MFFQSQSARITLVVVLLCLVYTLLSGFNLETTIGRLGSSAIQYVFVSQRDEAEPTSVFSVNEQGRFEDPVDLMEESDSGLFQFIRSFVGDFISDEDDDDYDDDEDDDDFLDDIWSSEHPLTTTNKTRSYLNGTRRRWNRTSAWRLRRARNRTRRRQNVTHLRKPRRPRTSSPTKERVVRPPDIQRQSVLREQIEYCNERRDSVDEVDWADCGFGYPFPNPNRTIPAKSTRGKDGKWRVFFVGSEWSISDITRRTSGCPKVCPLSPKCVLHFDSEFLAHKTELADVAVVLSPDYLDLKRVVDPRVPYRVVYWREASWSGPPVSFQKSHLFSFEMGIHANAALLVSSFLVVDGRAGSSLPPIKKGSLRTLSKSDLDLRLDKAGTNNSIQNPSFALRPSELLAGGFNDMDIDESQMLFAVSVISDCGSRSKRDEYLRAMMDTLGPGKVHRYGKCGDHQLPGATLKEALRRIAEYKFFLAFENTIQAGYMTEKIFTALMLPWTVPVYYGSPYGSLNITTLPSFIRATDFPSPRELALYLLRLSANQKERQRYLSWRYEKQPFTKEFLTFVANKVPGPEEVSINGGSMRSALCCRLCDESFVAKAARTSPKRQMFVEPALTGEEAFETYINHRRL